MASVSGLTRLALARPVTCMMVMVAMLLSGLMACRLIALDSWPAANMPMLWVSAPYRGSSPEEVERLLTKPLEEALATLGRVNSIESNSRADQAQLRLNLEWGADLDNTILAAREKVDMVRHLLPEDLDRVYVMKFSTQDMPIIEYQLSSERLIERDYDFLTRNLKQPLERIPGVGQVDLDVRQGEVRVVLDSGLLAANRVDSADLLRRLRAANFLTTVGDIHDGQQVWHISPDGQFAGIDDIRNLLIKDNVRLADVADVSLSYRPMNGVRRVDGLPAIGLQIFKESDANLVEVSRAVRAVLADIQQSPAFAHIHFQVMNDAGTDVEGSISNLINAGITGALLSFLVLLAFIRDVRITLVVVASVPIALAIAISGMYFLGYSLNMLSLMGLLIAVGLLIDNAVVVCESILQQPKSLGVEQQVLSGVDKVAVAILSATLTTVIIFLPLLMGEKNVITTFIQQIAVAICLPLLASLLIAKTLIPLLMKSLVHRQALQFSTEDRLHARYQHWLTLSLRHPKSLAVFFALLFASAYWAKGQVDNNVDYEQREDSISVVYHFIGQPELARKTEYVDSMEQYLLANKAQFGIAKFYTMVWPNFARTEIKLVDTLPMPITELRKKLADGFPKTALAKPSFSWMEGAGNSVSMSLYGSSTSELKRLAEQIVPQLNAMPGLQDVRNKDENSLQELLLKIDRDKVSQLGLDTQTVASRIGSALRGEQLKSLRTLDSGEVGIWVSYFNQQQIPMDAIRGLPIVEHDGVVLTLQQLVDIEHRPVMETIKRKNRQTELTLEMNLVDVSRPEAGKRIGELMSQLQLPPGYSWELGERFNRDRKNLKEMLFNMLLAGALIFMVMAALFESLLMPLAILSSIALAFVGVYWTFALLGTGLGDTGMIGMLVLMGIVVNNGIVLIDQINQQQQGPLLNSIVSACVSRLRPILMTVATTIIGMLPVALGVGATTGDFVSYKPMAIAIIGGLSFSTLTSLLFVPYCYWLLVRLGQISSQALAKRKHRARLRWTNV